MILNKDASEKAINQAYDALRNGNRLLARRWAEKAVKLSPESEHPWLVLAAVASPRASISYLQEALKINPYSQTAREGMHWAIKRIRKEPAPIYTSKKIEEPTAYAAAVSGKRTTGIFPWIVAFFILILCAFSGIGIYRVSNFYQEKQPFSNSQIKVTKYTRTPTPTFTFTPTATSTATFTPSPTPTATSTASPTLTSTPTETQTNTPTQIPSLTPAPTQVPPKNTVKLPDGVGRNERWIDIDLSKQRTFAYQGDELIEKFTVSTGTTKTPTIAGQFKIYVKYRYANMRGDDYFLEDVPFVMYFYKSYGIHGTYWHTNFGVPMSHGCVNLKKSDAKWLYNWASVGTVVRIHK